MKNCLKTAGQWIFAMLLSVLITTILVIPYDFYSNREPDPMGATDYKYADNGYLVHSNEGYAIIHFDSHGYNNIKSFDEDGVDVLLMGASQMEGVEMPTKYITASLATEATGLNIYNIGMSSHYFLTCVKNLENAVKAYAPEKYVIIQTNEFNFSNDDLNAIINNTYPKQNADDPGLVSTIKRYLPQSIKTARKQLVLKIKNDFSQGKNSPAVTETETVDINLLDQIMKKCSIICDNYGIKLIILHTPWTEITKDGISDYIYDDNTLSIIELCNKYDFGYINTYENFRIHYDETYEVPYGYANSTMGEGHLNKVGHRLVSEDLSEYILSEIGK